VIGSIGHKVGNFTRWIGEQVNGENDYGSGDDKTRDYAVLGATAGAVAGAAIGTVAGFNSQETNSIDEVWKTRNINHPEMNGYSHSAVPVFDTDCTPPDSEGRQTCTTEIEGWWHHYSPNIHNRVVGNYQEPTFQNTNFLEPLMGGLLGAVGGGAVGLAAGIGVAALQRTLQEKSGKASPKPVELKPEVKDALNNRTGVAVLTGAAIGVGAGALLGSRAGNIELGAQQVHNRTWSIPVTQTETLGHVPASHYEWNWSGFPLPLGGNRAATEPVNRQVPVYNRSNEPRLTHTSKTFTTNRYGPIFGGIAGGLMGAGVGLAAGVAFGVTDKMLTERNVAQEAAKKDAA
jgi:hypothetical protein